jgi:hypothetical protein
MGTMTIKELIEKLQGLENQDAEVFIDIDRDGLIAPLKAGDWAELADANGQRRVMILVGDTE